MRLIVFQQDQQVAEVTGQTDATYIGAGADCAVRLDDDLVAPHHAVIYPDGEDWVLQPLVDRGDLLLGETPLYDNRTLQDGDRITLHGFVIQVQIESRAAQPIESTDSTDDPLQGKSPDRAAVDSMSRFARYQLPPGSTVKKLEEPVQVTRSELIESGRLNQNLSACETPEPVMDIAIRAMFESFGAHRVWIGLRRLNYGAMEYVEGRTMTGQTIDLPTTADSLRARALDRGQFVLIPRVSPEEPCSVLTGPLTGPDGTVGMVYVDVEDPKRRFDEPELDRFVFLLATIGAQLDAIFRGIAKQRAATVQGEVAVAHAIQQRLNPRKLPQWEQLQLGAFREPGRERSSDLYDVVRLSNQMCAFLLAHTTATGSLSCQHIAQAQAAFRTALMHMDAPHIFLKSLNALLFDGHRDHQFHCIMGAIDPNSGKMHFAIAGDIRAYVISQRGEDRKLTPDESLPPAGTARNVDYVIHHAQLDSGETLAIFTPGVVTAKNHQGDVFGEDRFVNILCDGFGQLASSMLKEMLSDLQSFTEGGTQPEDITVILSHRV